MNTTRIRGWWRMRRKRRPQLQKKRTHVDNQSHFGSLVATRPPLRHHWPPSSNSGNRTRTSTKTFGWPHSIPWSRDTSVRADSPLTTYTYPSDFYESCPNSYNKFYIFCWWHGRVRWHGCLATPWDSLDGKSKQGWFLALPKYSPAPLKQNPRAIFHSEHPSTRNIAKTTGYRPKALGLPCTPFPPPRLLIPPRSLLSFPPETASNTFSFFGLGWT